MKLFEKTLEGSQTNLLHHCCLLVLVKAQLMQTLDTCHVALGYLLTLSTTLSFRISLNVAHVVYLSPFAAAPNVQGCVIKDMTASKFTF